MSLLLFLRGMLLAIILVGSTTYFLTGSLWTTLLHSFAAAVVVQVGYFVGVLWLVWRGGSKKTKETRSEAPKKQEFDANQGTRV